jgi:hypothetical protein
MADWEGLPWFDKAGQSAQARAAREVTMPVIVVTRLRLRDPAFFDEFFAQAVAVVEQAKNSQGNLDADVLAEANNTYWTRTAWQERGLMDAFVGSEPHLSTMGRLGDWCDEATFADWEQTGADLPDWQDSYRRLIANGQAASLTNATEAHHTRDFPAPVVPS